MTDGDALIRWRVRRIRRGWWEGEVSVPLDAFGAHRLKVASQADAPGAALRAATEGAAVATAKAAPSLPAKRKRKLGALARLARIGAKVALQAAPVPGAGLAASLLGAGVPKPYSSFFLGVARR